VKTEGSLGEKHYFGVEKNRDSEPNGADLYGRGHYGKGKGRNAKTQRFPEVFTGIMRSHIPGILSEFQNQRLRRSSFSG